MLTVRQITEWILATFLKKFQAMLQSSQQHRDRRGFRIAEMAELNTYRIVS